MFIKQEKNINIKISAVTVKKIFRLDFTLIQPNGFYNVRAKTGNKNLETREKDNTKRQECWMFPLTAESKQHPLSLLTLSGT